MDSDDDYEENKLSRAKRRRVTNAVRARRSLQRDENDGLDTFVDLNPLIESVENEARQLAFEAIISEMLPDLVRTRDEWLQQQIKIDQYSQPVRPLTRHERDKLINELQSKSESEHTFTFLEAMILRKLKLARERNLRNATDPDVDAFLKNTTVTPMPAPRSTPPVNPEVIDALYSIRTTPYENSFLSRLLGVDPAPTPGLIAADWETCSPWMALMDDIRVFYSFSHPEREQIPPVRAPIEYVSLQHSHLDQVHDLLARTFWAGIDVSDSLQFSPEKCTVIASYRKLVVGVAFLSSPQETYITYLAVRTGWENSQIATNMLYHLITLNPHKDISLHVSTNNPAMLLYNRFGFKAEEFIAGFYDAYLDPQSRASKNAFRLRLRR